MTARPSTISTRLAAALLIGQGEVTLEEIEALPLVYGRDEAIAIANQLLQAFEARQRTRRQGTIIELSKPIPEARAEAAEVLQPLTQAEFARALRRVSAKTHAGS